MRPVWSVIAPGRLAGAEQVALAGGKALVELGIDVTLVVIPTGEEATFVDRARALGVRTRIVPRVQLPALLARAASQRPILHSHGYAAAMVSAVLSPVAARWIATAHGFVEIDDATRKTAMLERQLLKACDRVICVSQALADDLAATGIARPKLTVVDNPLRPLPRAERKVAAVGGPWRLLSLGRLSHEKGVDVVLDALATSAARCTLTIVGDGPEAQTLRRQATALGLQGRVFFLGWRSDVAELLAAHDALVMPSRSEGLPLSALEALSSGLPVLATTVGALPALLSPGAGRVAPASDVAAFASLLDAAYADRHALRAEAEGRAPLIRDHYSAERWAQRMQGHLQETKGRRRWTGLSLATIGAATLRRRST